MKSEIAVTLEVEGSRRDVVLMLRDLDVTAGDLLDVVGDRGHLSVDGQPVGRRRPLVAAGMRRGSVLVIAEGAPADGGDVVVDDPPHGVAPSVPCSASGTDPWVRGPRRVLPVRMSAPSAPRAPEPPQAVVRPGAATVLVPIALAALTALLWNPTFAIFALIAPVVSVATWLEAERRHRVLRRTSALAHARDRLGHLSAMRTHVGRAYRVSDMAHPTASVVVDWPDRRNRRLWERRPSHDDFMRIRLGCGRERSVITMRLAPGLVAGVVGPVSERNDVARALLVQTAAHHGPVDCRVGLAADPASWQWMKWLPHLTSVEGEHAVATDIADRRLLGSGIVLCEAPPDPIALESLVGRGSVVVVLAEHADALPGVTGLVVDAGRAVAWAPGSGREFELAPDRLDEAAARRFAQAMARHHDPERPGSGGLPSRVRLVELLDGIDPEDISSRWKRAAADAAWSAPIGVGPDGIVAVDLRNDGPHALVGGTTGSGKSELLRTLVVSLAASLDPTRCNFVLIDYKGGSAFDACADLPHTVGLVTDLDEGLAERALVCLDAELRRREHVLRDAGVSDLEDLARLPVGPSLPRLVVVVDEFAAMVADLPDFVDRLVDVAQRGRSLGIHLVLATQRPSGVVGESIRANTDLRIALRVQSVADARDVVDDPSAAEIARSRPGRAVVRLARGRSVVQTAYTGTASGAAHVAVRPFDLEAECATEESDLAGPSDLAAMVESIGRAAAATRLEAGPSPWPPPLPAEVYRDEIPSTSPRAVFGIVDDPARQRQVPLEWSPREGHLLLFGLPGSGTTTALASLVVALSDTADPPDVYVVECEGSHLLPLDRLGNVGAVIGLEEHERVLRLVRMLESRRTADDSGPVILVVDGLDVLLGALDEIDPTGESASIVATLMTAGSRRRVSVVATTKRPSGVPHRIVSVCPRRLVFSLADRYDYRALGCSQVLVDPVPGRAVDVAAGCEVQIALPHRSGLAHAVDAVCSDRTPPRPPPVEALPALVRWVDLPDAPEVRGDVWRLPLGVEDRSRGAACLALEPGVRALVAGPARAGKSMALLALANAAGSGGLEVVGLAPPRSPLHAAAVGRITGEQAAACAAIESASGPVLVLIDDAGLMEAERLVALAAAEPTRIRIVAAGQTTRLRSRYGSWTASFGPDGVGLLLDVRPGDGELLGARLPARPDRRRIAGRGWLVERGRSTLVQVALSPT